MGPAWGDDGGGVGDRAEELAAEPSRRAIGPIVAVGVVGLALAGVAVAGHAHGGHRASRADAARPVPAASPGAAAVADASAGWVFLEHLPQCTRVGVDGTVHVAVGVTNLSDGMLAFVGAAPLDLPPGIRLAGSRLGHGPCGVGVAAALSRLRPSADFVLALTFARGPGCPGHGALATRLGFDSTVGPVYAESSTLADLARLPCR